jgi:[ribosomal protein S5]-alanine N-acetyltransferase
MYTAVHSVIEEHAARLSVAADHAIDTENLRLRIVDANDLDHYVGLLGDPEVMRYVGIEGGRTLSRFEVSVVVELATNVWPERGYGRWSVFEKTTGDFVGFAGFRRQDDLPELIAVTHKRYWGCGHAVEAGRACLDHGFSQLGFTTVCSYVRPTNARAIGFLKKLGAEFVENIDYYGVSAARYRIQPRPEAAESQDS